MTRKPKTLMPKLRFPEFRTNWGTQRLDAIAQPITERAGNRPITPYTVTTGVGLVSQQDRFGRTIAGSAFKNYYVLRKDDFAYNKSATKAYPQGYIARFLGEEGAVPNSIFTCFRVDADLVNPAYLDYLFAGNLHGRWLRRFVEVSARAHGSLSVDDADLMSLPVPVPEGTSSPAEQRKIAACLTSLDEWIAAEERKVETLRAHKKGLMRQLFPREGETGPRLRFPEFRSVDDWDSRTIGELGDVLMCRRILADQTNTQQGIPFFKIGTLGGTPDAYISKELYYDYRERFSFPKKGEVLITCAGTVGKCVPYDGEDAYYQDSNIVWIDNPREEVSNQFLFFLLVTVDWGKLNTTTITRIYLDDLRALSISVPRQKEEQQRIVDCLSSLDVLIAAQSKKLDGLRAHKKGLMQQLFPSLEGTNDTR